MIDKKTEADIRGLGSFLELWGKFHAIYSDIISKETIVKEDEAKFLETKGLIQGKYNPLKNNLDFKYMPQARFTDPVDDILALGRILNISEKNINRLNEDWKDSYIFLNNILERLKNKRRRLEGFSPVGVFIKRFFERR